MLIVILKLWTWKVVVKHLQWIHTFFLWSCTQVQLQYFLLLHQQTRALGSTVVLFHLSASLWLSSCGLRLHHCWLTTRAVWPVGRHMTTEESLLEQMQRERLPGGVFDWAGSQLLSGSLIVSVRPLPRLVFRVSLSGFQTFIFSSITCNRKLECNSYDMVPDHSAILHNFFWKMRTSVSILLFIADEENGLQGIYPVVKYCR